MKSSATQSATSFNETAPHYLLSHINKMRLAVITIAYSIRIPSTKLIENNNLFAISSINILRIYDCANRENVNKSRANIFICHCHRILTPLKQFNQTVGNLKQRKQKEGCNTTASLKWLFFFCFSVGARSRCFFSFRQLIYKFLYFPSPINAT